MTDAQHTRGPWQYFLRDGTFRVSALNGPIIERAGRRYPKGICRLLLGASQEAEANARLIVTAPDLLPALESFAQCGDEVLANLHAAVCHTDRSWLAVEVLAARAAIAKAKGETE